jgi:hypothetical protein
MTARLLCALGLASALFVTAACDGGLAITDVPAAYADTICSTYRNCAPADLLGSALDDCDANYTGIFTNAVLPVWQSALDRGTVGYDADAASRCLTETQALGCNAFNLAGPAACREILVGTLDTGSPCSFDEECVGDAYCNGADCPTTSGTCSPRSAGGGACDADSECLTGLVCNAGSCGASASRSGGPCDGPDAIECPIDEACVGGSDEAVGTCTPITSLRTAAEGEMCELGGTQIFCQQGLACAAVALGAGGATFECRARVAAGGACFVAAPSMCPDDQYCDADPTMGAVEGTCQARPTESQPCAMTLTGTFCGAGLVCLGGETCVRPKANGQACTDDGECFSGSCASGSCTAPSLCAG